VDPVGSREYFNKKNITGRNHLDFTLLFWGPWMAPAYKLTVEERGKKMKLDSGVKNVACTNQKVQFQLIKQLARGLNIPPWTGC